MNPKIKQLVRALKLTMAESRVFHIPSPSQRMERGRRQIYVNLKQSLRISIILAITAIVDAKGYAEAKSVT